MLNPMDQYIAIMQRKTPELQRISNQANNADFSEHVVANEQSIAELGPQLWAELFREIWTNEQLIAWRLKLPSYDCQCSSFYDNWVSANPPTFPLSSRWKYDLKSAVNAKLNQPNISFAEACQKYNWHDLTADIHPA